MMNPATVVAVSPAVVRVTLFAWGVALYATVTLAVALVALDTVKLLTEITRAERGRGYALRPVGIGAGDQGRLRSGSGPTWPAEAELPPPDRD